jgi:hypothetical protein
MSSTDERYEDILDRCIQQVLAGASPDATADAYPLHRAELLAALRPLTSLVAASVAPPASDARTAALHRMLAGVDAASSAGRRGFLFGALSSFSSGPVALRLASGAAAVLLFAGASVGASAATGHGPSWFFGGSSSGAGTQVRGAVSSSSAESIILTSQGIRFDVRLNAETRLSRNGAQIEAGDLKPGDVVQVTGKVGRDHVVDARDVEAEPSHGDDAPSAGATPGGNDSGSGDDERSRSKTETPESDGSHEGSGGDSGDGGHEGDATPRPAAPTSVSSGTGSPSKTPTATPHSGGGATSTPHSGDTPEAKTPEPD